MTTSLNPLSLLKPESSPEKRGGYDVVRSHRDYRRYIITQAVVHIEESQTAVDARIKEAHKLFDENLNKGQQKAAEQPPVPEINPERLAEIKRAEEELARKLSEPVASTSPEISTQQAKIDNETEARNKLHTVFEKINSGGYPDAE